MIIPKVIPTKSNAEITSFEKITHITAITEKKIKCRLFIWGVITPPHPVIQIE